MLTRVLITNGGPHSAEAWAAATADMIFPVEDVKEADRKVKALMVLAKIAAALAECHADVQSCEAGHLEARGSARLGEEHDVNDHVDQAIAKIQEAAAGSPWEDHFKQDDVIGAVRQVVGDHFATSQHVDRLYHCDANPECPVAQSYRAQFHA